MFMTLWEFFLIAFAQFLDHEQRGVTVLYRMCSVILYLLL